MATKAAAMPAAVLKNCAATHAVVLRELAPSSLMRASNSRCFAVCGRGMNSSLDTNCTGIGDGKSDLGARQLGNFIVAEKAHGGSSLVRWGPRLAGF